MRARQAFADILYNGKSITKSLADWNKSFSYTDNADGDSDSADLSIANIDLRWMGAWMPEKGDILIARIRVLDWMRDGDDRSLYCGRFILDEPSFSGFPDAMKLGGVSQPADDAFKTTARSQTWEDITIAEIGTEICGRYGLNFSYDAEQITIAAKEQSKKSDSAFLSALCGEYGLSMKTYNSKIVVFDRESYKAKAAAAVIDRADMKSYSWSSELPYTGGTIAYTDPDTGEDLTYSVGGGSRIYACNTKCDNLADAEKTLKAAVNKENHGKTKMSFSTMGNVSLVAGQNVQITGFQKLNGKYYLDKVSHSLGGDYSTSYEASLVETPI